MTYVVRPAVAADALEACRLVRRSITELLAGEHHGDEATLEQWLANKTGANFEGWIRDSAKLAFVAEQAGRLLGFGLMNTQTGQLSLLYVLPEARFQGVSKALLRAMEEAAGDAGVRAIALGSSATARRFYASCGYLPDGDATRGFGVTQSYPMTKRLTPR